MKKLNTTNPRSAADLQRQIANHAIDEIMATASSYPEHDCYLWNHQHYHCRKEYVARICGTCGAVTGFRWRSIWRRIGSLLFGEDWPRPCTEEHLKASR